ncbi:MAG: flavocytochrome c [Treponema sp.]|nr:flavocytochrome c [Treponema sp.]
MKHVSKVGAVITCLALLFVSCSKQSGLKAGTYEATEKGNNGPVTVSVTVDTNKITDVKIVSHGETPGISDKAIAELPKRIVENQSTNLDTISGATNSSKAILGATRAALKKAGANDSDFTAAATVTQEADIEKTADVIIVGGGGAGLAAAVSANQNGASVIVVEKTSALGGNTLVCGGIYNAPDPELQKPEGIEDSVDLFIKQTWEAGDKLGNKELVTVLCSNAYDGLKWIESLGVEFKDKITMGAGSLYQRTHNAVKPLGSGFIDAYKQALTKQNNVEILMDTDAKDLITKDGKVVGVIAKGATGNTVTLHANKAVILATGGFAGNVELRQKYNTSGKWADLGPNVQTTNTKGVTGDGIFMAQRVNANVIDMDQIQLLHMGNPKSGAISGICEPLQTAGVLFINQEGKRFVREDGRRDDMCAAILSQTNGKMYVIESGDAIPDYKTATTLDGSPLTQWIDSGDIFMGETIEDLAKQINVPADTLKKTIDTYNASVDAQKDLDGYGRQLLKVKFTKGPWYANPRVPSAHHTMGGVQIDTTCHVIDTNGKRIPGLFAAGEVTGGIHGANRVGGNAVVDTVVFGRIAGEQAAKNTL